VVFIAVGTPPRPDGAADLTFIDEVARSIAQHLNGYKVIVTKSTVPVGTGKRIESIVREGTGGKHPFAVVSNPEFLREGSAIEDFMQPDRVVIGTRDPRAAEMMKDVYSPLDAAGVPFIVTDVETAELIKYASNGFLATKISFINEVAQICEAWGANVEVVSRGMGLDNRIGPKFLSAGPGFGGSCFPKDTRAAAQIAHEQGLRFRIIEAVLEVNEAVQARMAEKIDRAMDGVAGKTIAILGLSFKPNTDDIRVTRPCRSSRASDRGPASGSTIQRRWKGAGRSSRPRPSARAPTRRRKGRTPSSSSPSGTSSASWSSTACRPSSANRWWSTCATFTSRARWPPPASATFRSAGRKAGLGRVRIERSHHRRRRLPRLPPLRAPARGGASRLSTTR
jgi:hypothetical protein